MRLTLLALLWQAHPRRSHTRWALLDAGPRLARAVRVGVGTNIDRPSQSTVYVDHFPPLAWPAASLLDLEIDTSCLHIFAWLLARQCVLAACLRAGEALPCRCQLYYA